MQGVSYTIVHKMDGADRGVTAMSMVITLGTIKLAIASTSALTDEARADASFIQQWDVAFVQSKQVDEPLLTKQKSGNPGYLLGSPILVGRQFFDETVEAGSNKVRIHLLSLCVRLIPSTHIHSVFEKLVSSNFNDCFQFTVFY